MTIKKNLVLLVIAALICSVFSAKAPSNVTFNGIYTNNILPNSKVTITLSANGKVIL
jgi:hypothetical protein